MIKDWLDFRWGGGGPICLMILIAKSPTFEVYDAQLHQKLVRKNQNSFWRFVAWINQPILMVGWCFLLAFVQLVTNGWGKFCWVLAGLGFANVIGIIIKNTLRRERPRGHLAHDDDFSFPSGHVLGTTVMALMLWQLYGSTLWLALTLVIWWSLVALCRLTLRAHYPSDVLGATLLAISWLGALNLIVALIWGWLRL